MAEVKVVVLGGGIGGVVAASEMRRRLPWEHRVIVVDRQTKHFFAPSFLWLMLGWRRAAQISRDLVRLRRKGIEFVNAEVRSIDPHHRTVNTNVGPITYDYLVISLGAALTPGAIPGLAEAAHHPYSLQGASKLRRALETFSGGDLPIVISRLPFKCPAAPYETAFLLDYHFRCQGIRQQVNLQIFTPEPQPMPVAGPALGEAVKALLEARDIAFHSGVRLAAVDSEKREVSFEDGIRQHYDLLLAIPPHACPQPVQEAGLTGEGGWVTVDKATLRTRFDNVYAIGDIAAVPLANGMPLPKAGVFAHGQAQVVAHNIANEVLGKAQRKQFKGHGYCFLEVGDDRAAIASGNFFAEPAPRVKLRGASRPWRWLKVALERYWLWRWL